MATELQAALKRWDASDMDELMEPEATLIKAARRVANLDYNAGRKAFQLSTGDADQAVIDAIDAALGIRKDTDGLGEAGMLTENQHQMKDNDAALGITEDTASSGISNPTIRGSESITPEDGG